MRHSAENDAPVEKWREAGWQSPDDILAALTALLLRVREVRDSFVPMVDQGSGAYLNPRVVVARLDEATRVLLPAASEALVAPSRVPGEESRCTSQSEDGRRCHGDVGHPGTHWAGASRVWSDTETLLRPRVPGEET